MKTTPPKFPIFGISLTALALLLIVVLAFYLLSYRNMEKRYLHQALQNKEIPPLPETMPVFFRKRLADAEQFVLKKIPGGPGKVISRELTGKEIRAFKDILYTGFARGSQRCRCAFLDHYQVELHGSGDRLTLKFGGAHSNVDIRQGNDVLRTSMNQSAGNILAAFFEETLASAPRVQGTIPKRSMAPLRLPRDRVSGWETHLSGLRERVPLPRNRPTKPQQVHVQHARCLYATPTVRNIAPG